MDRERFEIDLLEATDVDCDHFNAVGSGSFSKGPNGAGFAKQMMNVFFSELVILQVGFTGDQFELGLGNEAED